MDRGYENQLGATMVESALVLVTVLAMILGLVDLGRYLAVKGLLTYGTVQGVNLASTSPLLLLDGRPCSDFHPVPPACNDSDQTANRDTLEDPDTGIIPLVNKAAKRTPLATMLGDIGMSGSTVLTGVEVVRPGDASHPLPNCRLTPVPYNGYRTIATRCPVVVTLTARVNMLTPFFPNFNVRSVSTAFVDEALIGSIPPPAGGGTGTPSPSASSTPSPSPTGTPDPTPTPTPCPHDCDDPSNFFCCNSYAGYHWDNDSCTCESEEEGHG